MVRSCVLGVVGSVFLLSVSVVQTQGAVSNLDLDPPGSDDGAFDRGTGLPPPSDLLAPATPRAGGSPFDEPETVERPVRPFSEVGYGPFAIGEKVDIFDPEIVASLPDAGAINPECQYVRIPQPQGELFLMLIDGVLARIDVDGRGPDGPGKGPVLPNGVGVGSSVAALQAAYGDTLTSRPNKYGVGTDYRADLTPVRGAVFETEEGIVTAYRVGRTEEVGWVEGCS